MLHHRRQPTIAAAPFIPRFSGLRRSGTATLLLTALLVPLLLALQWGVAGHFIAHHHHGQAYFHAQDHDARDDAPGPHEQCRPGQGHGPEAPASADAGFCALCLAYAGAGHALSAGGAAAPVTRSGLPAATADASSSPAPACRARGNRDPPAGCLIPG